ncbi:MAG: CidA/LrgA family protein [Paracoccus sp. (in: a-proteobacteria)]|nr:CidA/LrgA family protein [Paracoccus sp. (in: a-proteobacteria)]
MIPGLTIILFFQLLGEVAARALPLPLPGPVAGLLALVAACALHPALAGRLRPVAQGVLGHMSLFFVPAGVGAVAHLEVLAEHGIGLALALAVSTVLAITAGAVAFVAVARLTGAGDDKADPDG